MTETPAPKNTIFGIDIGIDISSFTKKLISYRKRLSKRNLLIEFGKDYLCYGEAKYVNNQINFIKVDRVELDQEILEKGAPNDPREMGNFLAQIIEEEKIYAQRVTVVLPPEASLSKVVYLPQEISYENAREYILNSKSGFQFPIPLKNTDFDLIPIYRSKQLKNKIFNAYFITSIPKKVTDNIIKTLQTAGLELSRLEVAFTSQIRLLYEQINELDYSEYIGLLELNKDCSYFNIIGKMGINKVDRITGIRDFPGVINENTEFNSIEETTINSENYLPISNLDLRTLINEQKQLIKTFESVLKGCKIKEIFLNGINSCHPGIDKLLAEKLDKKVTILKPLSSKYIGNFHSKEKIIFQSFNRLIGLGLGGLPNEKRLDINKKNFKVIVENPKLNNNSNIDLTSTGSNKNMLNKSRQKSEISSIDKVNHTAKVKPKRKEKLNPANLEFRSPTQNISGSIEKNLKIDNTLINESLLSNENSKKSTNRKKSLDENKLELEDNQTSKNDDTLIKDSKEDKKNIFNNQIEEKLDFNSDKSKVKESIKDNSLEKQNIKNIRSNSLFKEENIKEEDRYKNSLKNSLSNEDETMVIKMNANLRSKSDEKIEAANNEQPKEINKKDQDLAKESDDFEMPDL